MSDTPLEILVKDWRSQSREILKNYFVAKENNDEIQIEIIKKTMDKIAQKFITFLKEDLRSGKYSGQITKLDDYFSESGYLSFNQMFDFENKVLTSVEHGVKNQTKTGFVNIPVNTKIKQLLLKLMNNEVSFHNLLKSLISDFNYIAHIIDSISESHNLVRWLKYVSVKANKSLLSAKDYKDLNKLVDILFGKLPVQGVRIPKRDQEERELLSKKMLGFIAKSEEVTTHKNEILTKLILFIDKLNNIKNQSITVHDTRPLFDYNNQMRFLIENQKELLHHIKAIVDNCRKFAGYSPNLSVSHLFNVDIMLESDTYTDLLEIQGKIIRQTSTPIASD